MSHRADLFVALQRTLPKHGLSRVIAKLAESKRPWLKNKLISAAIKAFDINMAEAATEDLDAYENFNAFFTRELREGARPIDNNPSVIVSPADGRLLAAGRIDGDRLIQAKNHCFS